MIEIDGTETCGGHESKRSPLGGESPGGIVLGTSGRPSSVRRFDEAGGEEEKDVAGPGRRHGRCRAGRDGGGRVWENDGGEGIGLLRPAGARPSRFLRGSRRLEDRPPTARWLSRFRMPGRWSMTPIVPRPRHRERSSSAIRRFSKAARTNRPAWSVVTVIEHRVGFPGTAVEKPVAINGVPVEVGFDSPSELQWSVPSFGIEITGVGPLAPRIVVTLRRS